VGVENLLKKDCFESVSGAIGGTLHFLLSLHEGCNRMGLANHCFKPIHKTINGNQQYNVAQFIGDIKILQYGQTKHQILHSYRFLFLSAILNEVSIYKRFFILYTKI
jgi:hypothetical protein